MASKSLLLGAVAFVISFTFTSVASVELQCNFLTFGQEIQGFPVCTGLINGEYCCYNPLRQPYCCNEQEHTINIVLWFLALIGIICVIAAIIQRFCPIGRRAVIFL